MEFGFHKIGTDFVDFFTNPVLLCAIFSWFLAQIIKLFTGIKGTEKTTVARFLVGSGGMPSSHSAVVTATCFSIGLLQGFDTPLFAVSAVLAVVVMRDASGVRRESGKQAAVINQVTRELNKTWKNVFEETLSELLGHTPMQVLFGALLGILTAFLCQYWFFPTVLHLF